jgi:hypothetical protein
MKKILIVVLAYCIFPMLHGQNFIGLNSAEIAGLMKSVHPQFKPDKSTINHSFKYLKYIDKISEQTVLFFMSDNDLCTYVRWMSDYSNLNEIIESLNRKYKKNGTNSWTYTDKGEEYSVTLVEDEWYFTVNFRKN